MKDFNKDFPLLGRKYQGNKLIYFDNAATAPKPQAVISSVVEYYTLHNANIHRGPNFLEGEATDLYENARVEVARFINCHPDEVIFTSGATAALNLVARSYGEANLQAGDVIAITIAEHHANIVPWLQLKEKMGIEIMYIGIDEEGNIDEASWQVALAHPRLRLVSLTQASNVLGQLYDIKPMIAQAKERGAITCVDACQSIAHAKVDVTNLDCDFLAFSGHKLFAPSGVGVLYGRKDILSTMPAFLGGGGMISAVKEQSFVSAPLPYAFEAGTPNIEGAIGLGAAISYVNTIGWTLIEQKEKELAAYFLTKLETIPFAKLLGGKDNRLPLFSLALSGLHPHDAADLLGEEGIITRAGHHCAQPLHDSLGVPASLRASLSFYNTKEEIDRFFDVLSRIYSSFVA